MPKMTNPDIPFIQSELTIPHSSNLEAIVLGSLLIEPKILTVFIDKVKLDYFYDNKHKAIFISILFLFENNHPVSLSSVFTYIENNKPLSIPISFEELSLISERSCVFNNFDYHLGLLKAKAGGRKLITISEKLRLSSHENNEIDEANKSINEAVSELESVREKYIGTAAGEMSFDWKYPVDQTTPDIEFNEAGVLWQEGIGLLTGPAGKGKTNVLLAAAASCINPDCDSISLKINCSPVLYVDTENQLSVFHRNVRRAIINRAGLAIYDDFDKVSFMNIRALETFEQKENWLWAKMRLNYYKCFILDGIGDLVLDVNDVETCVALVSKISAMTSKHKCSIFLTLHGNPLNAAEKARGILGSELVRKADCNMLLKVEKDARCITTEFSLGKNRAANDKLTQYFEWDTNFDMHISCEKPIAEEKGYKNSISEEEIAEMQNKCVTFIGDKNVRNKELLEWIMIDLGCSQSTAKRRISNMVNNNFLIKINDNYRLFDQHKPEHYADQND